MKFSKFIRGIVIALALSVVVSTPTVASASSKLSPNLLGANQVPKGWTSASSGSSDGIKCLDHVMEPAGIKQTSITQITFTAKGNALGIQEGLATYDNAKTAYSAIVKNLSGCKTASSSSGETRATSMPIRFPHYGSSSQAFGATFDVNGTTNDDVSLIVLKVNMVMFIEEFNYPRVNVSQFEGLVAKA
jgi:hypothetical protein